MKVTITLLTLGLVTTLGHANSAVSEVNGKLGTAAGSFDSNDGNTFEGSISMPIGEELGIQLDGYYADVEDVDFGGVGAHFFWRDNKVGLLGLSAGALNGDHLDSYEFSVEGEYYLGQLTLGARAGYAEIDYDDSVPFIETRKGNAFGKLYAGFYALEDLWISASVESRFDNTYYGVDVEYQTPIDGLSIFGNATNGENNYDHAYVGLRYYFGGKKSLQDRHRKDDPKNMLIEMLTGVGNYGAEYNKRGKDYIEEEGYGDWGSGSYGSVITIGGGTSVGVVGPVGPELP